MRQFVFLPVLLVLGCGDPDPCVKNPGMCQDAGNGTCTGQCAPNVGKPFYGFALLWWGTEGATPPACPPVAMYPYPGWLDAPPTTLTCGECSCTPSKALCVPPEHMIANTGTCPGTSKASFDAPSGWDGTCTAMSPVSSADSLATAQAQVVEEAGCEAQGGSPTEMHGGTIAQACFAGTFPPGDCGTPGDLCVYPNVAGFSVCVQSSGDVDCPSTWPKKHLFFDNHDTCKCSCGDPTGESCSTKLTVYSDSACSQPLGSVMLSSDQPQACLDLPPGSMLGSKSATPPVYQAGICEPKTVKTKTTTMCCLR